VAGDNPSLLESSIFDPAKLKEQAAAFSESDLIRFFHSMAQTESSLRVAAHPRFQLEIGLVKLMEMRRVAPLSGIIERLTALEESLSSGSGAGSGSESPSGSTGGMPTAGGGARKPEPPTTARASASTSTRTAASAPAATSPKPAPPTPDEIPFTGVGASSRPPALPENSAPTPVRAAIATPYTAGGATATGAAAATAISRTPELEKIRQYLEKKRRPMMVTALDDAQSVTFSADEILIAYAPDARHMRSVISKPESMSLLREACQETLGQTPSIRVITEEPAEGAPLTRKQEAAAEQQRLRQQAEQIPAVQRVLEVFQGEIVEVRVTGE
jgi:DNA polymerase III gamma/tau subunit